MSAKKFKLKNGLSVLLIENHKSPVVSVQMWVKTGSADEKKSEEGISHFIEHLVFKGTEKYGVGQIASTVEANGGELNAYTSFDQTVFYVTISKEFSDIGLDVISEMMGFPKFESGEIDNEREVVLEEIKRGNDSPGREASRALFSSVYKKHPYGIPVIGYEKVIKRVSRKTLVSYYTSRYVPTNMQLVIAGDFETKDMMKKVGANFSRLKAYKLRKVSRPKELAQKQPRLNVKKVSFEETQFHLAWRIPGATHKDAPALDVLALVLGQGESSRLSQKLRMENPYMNSIGASTFTPKDSGVFTISGALNADQAKVGMQVLMTEIERILREPPHPEELKKAITNFESEEFYSLETVDGIARKAGSLENLMGDYKYFQKYLKQIYALKPEDILKAARKYLTPETMTLVMLTPRDEKARKAELQKWIKEYTKVFRAAKAARALPAHKMKIKKVSWSMDKASTHEPSAVEKIQLKSGATLIFRPSFATPVFSARAAVLGGLRIEPKGQGGVTELLSRVWTSGTAHLSELDIQNKIENMAGGLGGFGGRNSAGLSMQTFSPFEEDAIDLFGEALARPVISESVLEREKIMMMESLRSREDSPGQIVSHMFLETIYKGHPYSEDPAGSKESVPLLTKKMVDQHYQRMMMSKNLMVVVTGAVNRKKWVDGLEKALSHLPKGEKVDNKFAHQGPKQEERVYKTLQKEQSHIILGFKGLTLTDPRRYALQVIQSVLAGQGGRLFIELRDKASLAYTVSPMRMEGIDAGYFGAYIGCTPSKGKKAISMLNIEFQKLVDTKISDVELDRAKRYLIGRHDIDLQRNSAIGSTILFNEIYGIPSAEAFAFAEKLRDISAKDVQNLAQDLFSQKPVLAAVGPEQPW